MKSKEDCLFHKAERVLIRLTKSLYGKGFGRQDVLNLYRFIDWLMALPKELERTFHQELMKFEKEKKMQYVTTAERIGMEKGRKETARNLLAMRILTHDQVAQATGLTLEEVGRLQRDLDDDTQE